MEYGLCVGRQPSFPFLFLCYVPLLLNAFSHMGCIQAKARWLGLVERAPSLHFQTGRWMRQMYGHETRRNPMLFHPHLKALALLSFIFVGQWMIFIFVLPNIFKMHICCAFNHIKYWYRLVFKNGFLLGVVVDWVFVSSWNPYVVDLIPSVAGLETQSLRKILALSEMLRPGTLIQGWWCVPVITASRRLQ